jgi:hypothetical protein
LLFVPGRTSDSPLVISELRFRGPNGANDEFVEIYNQTNSDVTVNATDGSSGYAVAASDGVIRFVIPNGTVIPARGHYLGANTIGYSLVNYPAGDGNVTTPDATFNVTTTASRCLPPAATLRSEIVLTQWAQSTLRIRFIAKDSACPL